MLVSDFYHIKKTHGMKVSDIIYRINHNTKRVVKVDKKWKRGKLYKERERVMKYYSKDDLLTLYFNLKSGYIKRNKNRLGEGFIQILKGLVRVALEGYRKRGFLVWNNPHPFSQGFPKWKAFGSGR